MTLLSDLIQRFLEKDGRPNKQCISDLIPVIQPKSMRKSVSSFADYNFVNTLGDIIIRGELSKQISFILKCLMF